MTNSDETLYKEILENLDKFKTSYKSLDEIRATMKDCAGLAQEVESLKSKLSEREGSSYLDETDDIGEQIDELKSSLNEFAELFDHVRRQSVSATKTSDDAIVKLKFNLINELEPMITELESKTEASIKSEYNNLTKMISFVKADFKNKTEAVYQDIAAIKEVFTARTQQIDHFEKTLTEYSENYKRINRRQKQNRVFSLLAFLLLLMFFIGAIITYPNIVEVSLNFIKRLF